MNSPIPPLSLTAGPSLSEAMGTSTTGPFEFKPQESYGLSNVLIAAVLVGGFFLMSRK